MVGAVGTTEPESPSRAAIYERRIHDRLSSTCSHYSASSESAGARRDRAQLASSIADEDFPRCRVEHRAAENDAAIDRDGPWAPRFGRRPVKHAGELVQRT